MKKLLALVAILVVVGGLFAAKGDKFMDDYREAERALNRKNYEQAYDIYSDIIRDAEDRGFAAEIKYRAAQAAYNLGRFEVAISLLEEILAEDIPEDSRYAYMEPQVKYSLGLSYFQIGETQRAQRFLDEAEELGGMGIADYLIRQDYRTAYDHLKDKEYPVDRLFLARSLINSRAPEYFSQIRSILTELADHVALEELVEFSRAEMQFFNDDYATAKNVLRDFMTKYPQTALRPYAEYYLACSYYHDDQHRYAIDLLSKLTDPNRSGYILSAHAYFMRGEAYRALDLPDSASFSFEQARIVAPNSMVDFYTTYRLYEIYRDEGNIQVARREARRLGDIALTGREQRIMENLSDLVRGNIEFDQTSYVEALNYYTMVTNSFPPTDAASEERFVFEAGLVMRVLTLNRQERFRDIPTPVIERYLSTFPKPVPIEFNDIQYGEEWRAYLLYNQADAIYYSAYGPYGEVRFRTRRESAREKYQSILETYPRTYMSTLAKVALAWYKLEDKRFQEAITEFRNIIDSTRNKDATVLAAYGTALGHFYQGEYASAGNWFLNEEEYVNGLGVTVDREQANENITYNEIADSLIARSLYWRGICFENIGAYRNALDLYQHIFDTYVNRDPAAEAAQKVIEIYLRADSLDRAEGAADELRTRRATNPRIYRDAYGFALAQLYDYYYSRGNEAMAEDYADRLRSETGSTKKIEQLYYTQAMRDTAVTDIADLRDKIEKIRTWNPRSDFLPDPLFLLSMLLIEDKNFDEAQDVLVELKTWPDANVVRDRMPEISYQLARVYFQTEEFDNAVTELESWVEFYTSGENERPDLAPYVYYFQGLSFYNLGDGEEDPQRRRSLFRKALTNFQHVKENYADSQLYETSGDQIEVFIQQCRRELG